MSQSVIEPPSSPRLNQLTRCAADLGVRISDRVGIGPGVVVVEANDGGVEPLPELVWASASGARAKFVRRIGVFRSWNRPPREPELCGIPAHCRLGRGGLA